jgi:DNA ligase (NAD+)
VGSETAELLAHEFSSIDELAKASKERLMSIPSIGPKIAEGIVHFFAQVENRQIIEKLRRAGVKLDKSGEPRTLPLSGQQFVITGRLETFPRDEAEARIRALGGSTSDNVSRKTTFLVVGAEPGSKTAKAQALGVKTITEGQLLAILGQQNS